MWYYILKNRKASDVQSLQKDYPWHYYMQQGDDVLVMPELQKPTGEYIERSIEGGTFYYLQVPREQYLIPIEAQGKIQNGIWNIVPYVQEFKKFLFTTELKTPDKKHPLYWNKYRNVGMLLVSKLNDEDVNFFTDDIGRVICTLALVNSYKITGDIMEILDLQADDICDICEAAIGVSREEVKKN